MAPTLTRGGTPTSEMFNRIRRIEIRTSKLVNELFGGRYHSVFKGRGMEYVDTREYIPGDDVRAIHWTVTARLGHPYVKRFTEERELTILLVVDVSGSNLFGTHTRLKSDLAAELVSLLAFSALKNNDKIGLLLFSDAIESYIPPRKSQSHSLRLIRDVLNFKPKNSATNLGAALEYVNMVQKKRAIVFVISDFMDQNYEKELSVTRRRHDTIAFVLEDPMEKSWPKVSPLVINEAETGERHVIRGWNSSFQTHYQQFTARLRTERNRIFKRNNLDHVIFQTNQDYVRPLLTFFKERARRFR